MTSALKKDFFDWIDDLLEDKKWSRERLGNEADIDSGVLTNIWKGKRGLGPAVARRMADALGVEQDTLFEKAGLMRKPVSVNSNEADEQRNGELISVYKRLSDDDQVKLLEMAKAMKTAEDRLKKARPVTRRASA